MKRLWTPLLVLPILLLAQGCITTQVCSPAGAFETGRSQALAGQSADYSIGSSCEAGTFQTFQTSYEKGYAAGLQTLCSVSHIQIEGREAGAQGLSLTRLPDRYRVCTADRPRLEKAWKDSHTVGLNSFCSADDARSEGEAAAQKGLPLSEDFAKWQVCGSGLANHIANAYRTGYQAGLQTTNNAAYSVGHQVTREETEQPSSRQCSFEKGLVLGKRAAEREVVLHMDRPSFCDQTNFYHYERGYQQGWRDGKRLICTSYDSQELGYQDGKRGLRAAPRVPELCPSEYHAGIRERYYIGYKRGIRLAEAKHKPHSHEAHEPRPTYSSQEPNEDLINTCGQEFTFSDDKMKCIQHAQSINFGRVETVKACAASASFTSDRFTCLKTFRTTQYAPSDAIKACTSTFTFQSDRLKCFEAIATARRDPSEKIRACDKNFTFQSDKQKCIANREDS